MLIKQYIKDFERLGFGMFVHFGLYSLIGKGEWAEHCLSVPDEQYLPLAKQFNPDPDWAEKLVTAAKKAGCKYITLTTRHHEGFSLYDTCGLSDYDAPHGCGRDIVREFVDACRAQDVIPFFYHTLLDWHEKTYNTDFSAYLRYLRASVEILCKNYGKIGGLWFDGMWDKPEEDWQEDALYGTIRKYQPEAMIINNTGLSARGQLGNIELDSVTFERGKPQPINLADSPKYIASEMCQVFGDHWGCAYDDLNFKSTAEIIEELCVCRRYGSNYLINVGPMGNGELQPIEAAMLQKLGQWVGFYGNAIRLPRPVNIEIENKPKDFMLQNGEDYYLFVHGLPMVADENVALHITENNLEVFRLAKKVKSVEWLENGEPVEFEQEGDRVTVHSVPFSYGKSLVVRVALIHTA